MSTNGLTIKEKIAAHKPLTRREKAANKETVRNLASLHLDKADSELAKLLSDKRTPANTRMKAIEHIFDRIAGKPKLETEQQSEQSLLDKMNQAELTQYITEQMSGLDLPTRVIIRRSVDEGLAFDAADIMDAIEEPAPAKGLPPLISEPKPKREPRR